MVENYLIADFLLEVTYCGNKVLQEKLCDYRVSDDTYANKIKVNIEYTADSIPVRNENLVKISENGFYYSTENGDVLFYYDENVSKVIAKTEYSKDYKSVNIVIYELKKVLNVEDSQLTYNILGLAFNYIVQMHSGFVFHSSSVGYKDAGVAFSAKSGTGKSTHTNLWLNSFEGSYILNDDTPLIFKGSDNLFYISGTPWAGTTGINKNVVVPLKALVLLERGTDNSICQIPSGEAINFLFEGIRSPLTGIGLSSVLETFNQLLSSVPIYKLKCNMEPSAAELSKDTIYN